jgi:hypothetical protein
VSDFIFVESFITILDVSLVILDVSDVILVESDVTVVEVESVFTSVLEEPPLQAARIAEIERTISTFFILINLEIYNLFLVYTVISKK